MGIPAPTEYARSKIEARAVSVEVAMRVRIEPRMGPAQGVQRMAPKTNPPRLPEPKREAVDEARPKSPESLIVSRSNQRGQIRKRPKRASAPTAILRKASGEIMSAWTT